MKLGSWGQGKGAPSFRATYESGTRIGDPAGTKPMVFVGDPPTSFVVHGPSLRAPLPPIEGLRAVDDFGAWVMKKLYTFGAGHAAAAYLGALKGNSRAGLLPVVSLASVDYVAPTSVDPLQALRTP